MIRKARVEENKVMMKRIGSLRSQEPGLKELICDSFLLFPDVWQRYTRWLLVRVCVTNRSNKEKCLGWAQSPLAAEQMSTGTRKRLYTLHQSLWSTLLFSWLNDSYKYLLIFVITTWTTSRYVLLLLRFFESGSKSRELITGWLPSRYRELEVFTMQDNIYAITESSPVNILHFIFYGAHGSVMVKALCC
jgi:hypothetical protein